MRKKKIRFPFKSTGHPRVVGLSGQGRLNGSSQKSRDRDEQTGKSQIFEHFVKTIHILYIISQSQYGQCNVHNIKCVFSLYSVMGTRLSIGGRKRDHFLIATFIQLMSMWPCEPLRSTKLEYEKSG